MNITENDTDNERIRLMELYNEQPLTVDMLPYTVEMDQLVEAYNADGYGRGGYISHRNVYIKLMNLRKRGILTPKGRKPHENPSVC